LSKLKLLGKKIGKLTVIAEAGKNKHGAILWKCRCDCGNETILDGSILNRGLTKSCGCGKGNDRVNLKGKIFGDLTVVSDPMRENNKTYWLCRCICGNEVKVQHGNLTSKNTKSCGCRTGLLRDYTGQRFGSLLVVGKARDGTYRYKCICDCGNTTYVASSALKSGLVISCGCSKTLDLKGMTFGKLRVEENAGSKGQRHYWLCQCECGNYKEVCTNDLTSGKVISCGCVVSKGELYIKNVLVSNSINFSQQYTFNDLRSPHNKKYRFDFGILGADGQLLGLVEFDGFHHYFETSRTSLAKVRESDQIKTNYCQSCGIPINRIRYDEKLTLERILCGIPCEYAQLLNQDDAINCVDSTKDL
jgi:hypothetical protein